jgi:uncharacterized protein
MALALGLAFGLSACTITCLPYLGPVFLASDGGVRRSWQVVLPFSAGRMTGYAFLATLAGFAGEHLDKGIADNSQVRAIVGCAALFIGLGLWLRTSQNKTCNSRTYKQSASVPIDQIVTKPAEQLPVPQRTGKALLPGGLFLLGIGMTLTPCAPLGSVIFTAATLADPWQGLGLGLAFGLGAVFIPSLVYGIGVAYFGNQLRAQLNQHRDLITRLSAGLLILTGLGNLLR